MKTAVYIAIVVILLLVVFFPLLNQNEYVITVDEKVIKSVGDDGQKYLIFATLSDGTTKVFENTDAVCKFKFNSSDFQAKLKVGETYTIETIGFRIGIFSSYENIVKIKE